VVWRVVVRGSVRPLIDDLKGRKAGYARVYEQLRRDPCLSHPGGRPFAYRLSGPLQTKVCGVRLRGDYRLAFTMHPPSAVHEEEDIEGVVEVIYVGKRETRQRGNDVWTRLHLLFDEENPPADHLRPPCCDDGLPVMTAEEIDAYMNRLRREMRRR
jgi:hypothetical protein